MGVAEVSKSLAKTVKTIPKDCEEWIATGERSMVKIIATPERQGHLIPLLVCESLSLRKQCNLHKEI
jgi:hypothetical protein